MKVSIFFIGLTLFCVFNNVSSFDVADTSATATVYVNLGFSSYIDKYMRGTRAIVGIVNKHRFISATFSNAVQRVVRNHVAVREDASIIGFLNNIETLLMNSNNAVGALYSGLTNYAAFYGNVFGLIGGTQGALFDSVRISLNSRLTDCYVAQNAAYTSSVIKLHNTLQNCYVIYDSIYFAAVASVNAQIALLEAGMNLFATKFIACGYTTNSHDTAVNCVKNIVNSPNNFQTLVANVLNAVSLVNINPFTSCFNTNVMPLLSAVNTAVTNYQNCVNPNAG